MSDNPINTLLWAAKNLYKDKNLEMIVSDVKQAFENLERENECLKEELHEAKETIDDLKTDLSHST